MRKECRYKKFFADMCKADNSECELEFPSCTKAMGVCYFYDKWQDLSMEAESVMAEYRAERGGKE